MKGTVQACQVSNKNVLYEVAALTPYLGAKAVPAAIVNRQLHVHHSRSRILGFSQPKSYRNPEPSPPPPPTKRISHSYHHSMRPRQRYTRYPPSFSTIVSTSKGTNLPIHTSLPRKIFIASAP